MNNLLIEKTFYRIFIYIIIVLGFAIICHPAFAEYRAYIGQDDRGKVFAGLEATIPVIQQTSLYLDINTKGIYTGEKIITANGWTYTYNPSPFFSADTIIYSIAVISGPFEIGHKCSHFIDFVDVDGAYKENYISYKTKF